MTKHRLAFALILGLVLAVFVSACGVALGPAQFSAGGPVVLSPTISGMPLPALFGAHQPAVMRSMAHLQTFQATDQAQSLFNHAGGCHGLD